MLRRPSLAIEAHGLQTNILVVSPNLRIAVGAIVRSRCPGDAEVSSPSNYPVQGRSNPGEINPDLPTRNNQPWRCEISFAGEARLKVRRRNAH